ncbi:MAG: hypothetical protein KGN02_05940 [bacterium]|nr:hypothetical protein [bacterium]
MSEVGVALELLEWEDTLPGAARPQEVINRDLDQADLPERRLITLRRIAAHIASLADEIGVEALHQLDERARLYLSQATDEFQRTRLRS